MHYGLFVLAMIFWAIIAMLVGLILTGAVCGLVKYDFAANKHVVNTLVVLYAVAGP